MGGANTKYHADNAWIVVAAVVAVFAIDEVTNPPRASTSCSSNISATVCSCSWTSPARATTDEGYNLQQAKVAIGSGGLFGKGLFQGTQHSLGLLPEAPTDFIFCVLAEELGFWARSCCSVCTSRWF